MSWDVGAWVANVIKEAINTHKDATDALGTTVTTGGVPVVRKIQRGTATMDYRTESCSITLSGFSNLNKMIVLLDGFRKGGSASNYGDANTAEYIGSPYMTGLTVSKLTVACDGAGDNNNAKNPITFSYQVIECY